MKNFACCLFLLFLLLTGVPDSAIGQQDSYRSLMKEQDLVQGSPYESRQFRVEGPTELSVITLSGNIEVFENPRIDVIQIDLYVKRGFSFWSGGNLDNYRITFQEQAGKIVASVEPRRGDSNVWQDDNIRFSYVVQVPGQVTTRIRSMTGDIYARNLNGQHLLQANVGNVFIEGLTGETNAFSAIGNITANDVWGDFNAKTTNGNITLRGAEGEVRLRTVNGSIIAREIMGTFIAATSNGSVSATLWETGEGSYIETTNGSVSLTLPPAPDYHLRASGSMVNITDLLQIGAFEGNVGRRSADVRFGEGNIPIQISSSTGTINVETGRN